MGILLGLVVLVMFGLVALGAVGFLVFAGVGIEARGKRKLQARGEAFYDELFAGGALVNYNSRPVSSLDATPVIAAAMSRGYELVHDDNGQLLFKRTQTSSTT